MRQGCTNSGGIVTRETIFCTAVSKTFGIIISVFFFTCKNVYYFTRREQKAPDKNDVHKSLLNFRFLLWNLLHFILLASRIYNCSLHFWKICRQHRCFLYLNKPKLRFPTRSTRVMKSQQKVSQTHPLSLVKNKRSLDCLDRIEITRICFIPTLDYTHQTTWVLSSYAQTYVYGRYFKVSLTTE